jgi:hypothetical protein
MSMATTTTKRRARGARQAVNGTSGNVIVGAADRRRGDTETRGQGEAGLRMLQDAVQVVLASPSLLDGFNGARDAGILDTYAERTLPKLVRGGVVRVQCTSGTEAMLKRAGIKQPLRFEAYEVAVIKDRLGRLQLAPATKGGAES